MLNLTVINFKKKILGVGMETHPGISMNEILTEIASHWSKLGNPSKIEMCELFISKDGVSLISGSQTVTQINVCML